MQTPSKRMQMASVRKVTPFGWLFLAALVGGLGYWVYRQPYALIFIGIFAVIFRIERIFEKWRFRHLANSREELSICDFARSFGRETDTWVLRAVYEELSGFLLVDGRHFPVRATDNCEKDLKIDPEDLDDLAADIAFRARRSMENTKQNPFFGKVRTVADMVAFLEHQPRIAETEQSS